MMYIAILVFFLLILILSTDISFNMKSANDVWKFDAKIGLISFRIPHQRWMEKMIEKEQMKSKKDQRQDFIEAFSKRKLVRNIAQHSSLLQLYIAKFTKEELYQNPIRNGLYLIVSNQVYAYANSTFKRLERRNIHLIYDEKYANIDYYIRIKTDIIGLLTALVQSLRKGYY